MIGKLYIQKIIDYISVVEEQGELLVSVLKKLFPKKKTNSRGIGYQWHFGYWGKNSMINMLYETAESRNFQFAIFLAKTQHIWHFIAKLIEQDFKQEYDWYCRRLQQSNVPYTFGIWECLAINYLFGSNKHKDWGDIRNGLCVIIPAGRFTGGNIFLQEFNTVIELKHGDFLVLRSYEWYHENKEFVGDRSSYVLFTSI